MISVQKKIFSLLKKIPIGKEFAIFADSNSMWPLIIKGDKLIANRQSYKRIYPGEIIIFYSPKIKRIMIHKLVSVNQAGLAKTKGDNNFRADKELLREEFFLGVVKIILKEKIKIHFSRTKYTALSNRKSWFSKICRKLFFYSSDKPTFNSLVQKLL